ncbi:MAG: YceI family protein [Candidatus Acidiferrales bacterium]
MTEATGAKMSAMETLAHYRIDAGMSRFTVRAFATGLFSSLGHNPTLAIRGYTGEAAFVPGSLEQASVRISVQADSLGVTDDISQKDRTEIESGMKQDVLETSIYPEIVFESSHLTANKMGEGAHAVNASGILALHGVTRSETIYAQVVVTGDTLRAYGEFSLRQTDYGIKLVSVAGGTLKVKDEVKISFDFTARKQEG